MRKMHACALCGLVLCGIGWKKSRLVRLPEPSGDARIQSLLKDRELQALGEKLFFDSNLSNPPGQSCATCHDGHAGWTGPHSDKNKASGIYPGAVSSRFGNRKPISAAYATYSPLLHTRMEDGELLFVGGHFWDGRATGHVLGNPAADQAQGPFLNPVEHNFKDAQSLIKAIEAGPNGAAFVAVCRRLGLDGAKDEATRLQLKFGAAALAIAAFEHSGKLNAFSSKYDDYLRGKATLNAAELRGLNVFKDKGKCADCHPHELGPKGELPLFTDFTYDNLGFPANPQNPTYQMDASLNPEGASWIDEGLGGYLKTQPQYAALAAANRGKHRVPTLRNVDKRKDGAFVKRYGHNGYFEDLASIIHFYNTRDTKPFIKGIRGLDAKGNWPAPEVKENLNKDELGDLKLTAQEEADLLAFLKTLSDR